MFTIKNIEHIWRKHYFLGAERILNISGSVRRNYFIKNLIEHRIVWDGNYKEKMIGEVNWMEGHPL